MKWLLNFTFGLLRSKTENPHMRRQGIYDSVHRKPGEGFELAQAVESGRGFGDSFT